MEGLNYQHLFYFWTVAQEGVLRQQPKSFGWRPLPSQFKSESKKKLSRRTYLERRAETWF